MISWRDPPCRVSLLNISKTLGHQDGWRLEFSMHKSKVGTARFPDIQIRLVFPFHIFLITPLPSFVMQPLQTLLLLVAVSFASIQLSAATPLPVKSVGKAAIYSTAPTPSLPLTGGLNPIAVTDTLDQKY